MIITMAMTMTIIMTIAIVIIITWIMMIMMIITKVWGDLVESTTSDPLSLISYRALSIGRRTQKRPFLN